MANAICKFVIQRVQSHEDNKGKRNLQKSKKGLATSLEGSKGLVIPHQPSIEGCPTASEVLDFNAFVSGQ